MFDDEKTNFFKAAREHIGKQLLMPVPDHHRWIHLALRVVLLITLPVIALGLVIAFQDLPGIVWPALTFGFAAGSLYVLWMRRDKLVARRVIATQRFELHNEQGQPVGWWDYSPNGSTHLLMMNDLRPRVSLWVDGAGHGVVAVTDKDGNGLAYLGSDSDGGTLICNSGDGELGVAVTSSADMLVVSLSKDKKDGASVILHRNGDVYLKLADGDMTKLSGKRASP